MTLFGHPQMLELMRAFSGETAGGGDSYSHTLTTKVPFAPVDPWERLQEQRRGARQASALVGRVPQSGVESFWLSA